MPDRTDESELDELAVIPYGPQPGEEAPVYVFERTEAMPDADLSDFAETVANAFEADRE